MGNSHSNPENIESEINSCFVSLIDNISVIQYQVGPCDMFWQQHERQRDECIGIINTSHKAFNSKTDVENITNKYLIPLIQKINNLPIYTNIYFDNKKTSIKETKKLSSLIDQYIELQKQKQDRMQSLENENNELKKTISQMAVHQNPPMNPYASAPPYDK